MCFWAWKWGTKAWKNVIFKNNPFPLNKAISKLFPVYSAREISDARAFVTGYKGVSNRRGNLHPQKTSANFQSLVISPPFQKLPSWSLCCIFGLIAEIQQDEPSVMHVYYHAYLHALKGKLVKTKKLTGSQYRSIKAPFTLYLQRVHQYIPLEHSLTIRYLQAQETSTTSPSILPCLFRVECTIRTRKQDVGYRNFPLFLQFTLCCFLLRGENMQCNPSSIFHLFLCFLSPSILPG